MLQAKLDASTLHLLSQLLCAAALIAELCSIVALSESMAGQRGNDLVEDLLCHVWHNGSQH